MGESRKYPGMDIFRVIAALLVIAIHTSPLSSYSHYGDFLLTRVAGRVAVPFFFMVSGFFLFGGKEMSFPKVKNFVKRTAFLYVTSILLYLPVNWYMGYFKEKNLVFRLLRDIVIDGTMYHLWYLPAAITGCVISFLCLRVLGLRKALIFTAFLYLIGLFGDSYYGVIANVPGIGGFYKGLFQIMDYTRNGFFFAPLFFLLGAAVKKQFAPSGQAVSQMNLGNVGEVVRTYQKFAEKNSIWMLLCFMLLMAAEAAVLKGAGVMRHDSMYLSLPVVMFFLFLCLLRKEGKEYKSLRVITMAVYIIHPLVIIAVRGISKLLKCTDYTVNNSVIHFLAVAAGSFLAGGAYYLAADKLKKRKGAGVCYRQK